MSKKEFDSILDQFSLQASDSKALEEIVFEKNRRKKSESNSSESSEEVKIPSKRKRKGICQDGLGKKRIFDGPTEKSDLEKDLLFSVLSKSFIFSGLDYNELGKVIDSMSQCEIIKGDLVITAGELINKLFVMKSGKVQLEIPEKPIEENQPGAMFGEIALLHGTTQSFTVTALENTSFWVLNQSEFAEMVKTTAKSNNAKFEKLLKKAFQGVDAETLGKLLDGCQNEFFCTGEFIAQKGKNSGKLYMVYEGKAGSLTEENVEYVWERDLASSIVAESSVKCLSLTDEAIQRILDI